MNWCQIKAAAGALFLIATTASAADADWVDLTHPLSSESVFWPTARAFELTTDAEGMTEAGYYYSAYSFSSAEHGGTHIDAPVHFAEGRRSVDEIPLSQLMGPAVVIDVSRAAEADRDHRISVSELTAWEANHGRIPDAAIVLLRTDYSRYWPDAQAYLGTTLKGEAGVAALHFPGLDPQAAAWLVTERDVKAVGIDTASIDYGQSKDFASHVALMTANVPAFENVANLERLPATGAWVIALPLKIEGGSGGPLRIVAQLPKG
jgi:kynurenine formamidase